MSRAIIMPMLGAAAAGLGLLAVPAAGAAVHPAATGPAARFASEATPHQNSVIERALSRVPGGIRISASEVEWPNGIILGVPASPQSEFSECATAFSPTPVFCGFTGVNFTGDYIAAPVATTTGYWVPWGEDFDTGMHSWYNFTGNRVWREQEQNAGNELCIDPVGNGNYYDTDYNGPDVNDYWIWMSVNSSNCT
jgi:hypothetical protein